MFKCKSIYLVLAAMIAVFSVMLNAAALADDFTLPPPPGGPGFFGGAGGVALCLSDSGDGQAQIHQLQAQIVSLNQKLAAATSIDQNPAVKLRRQERIVSIQVLQIQDQVQDAKDEANGYKKQACKLPEPGGPPDGAPPAEGPPHPPSSGDDRPQPKMMAKNGPDGIQMLLLDLPDDLQNELDDAKEDLREAKHHLKLVKAAWEKKCEDQADARPKPQGQAPQGSPGQMAQGGQQGGQSFGQSFMMMPGAPGTGGQSGGMMMGGLPSFYGQSNAAPAQSSYFPALFTPNYSPALTYGYPQTMAYGAF